MFACTQPLAQDFSVFCILSHLRGSTMTSLALAPADKQVLGLPFLISRVRLFWHSSPKP